MKYKHTNLVTRDWIRLSAFYRAVFECTPVPPERDLSGDWLDSVTGIADSHIRGVHLRLPGTGEDGPTLEIFQYDAMPDHPPVKPNTPGFSHIAFEVDDVKATAKQVFENGGAPVGEIVTHHLPGVMHLTVQYVTDPDGNIIELQHKKEPS